MPNKLSIIIPCKNERENIGACIATAQQVADEVLVADSGSTDGTLEFARRLGCRIIEREYRTSGDFKNWAIPQAASEWVFILDADERITEKLAEEIRRTLIDPKHDGYWVYRLNHFMGHPIRFGPWQNDRCLRLFRRDLGRYVGPTDHAEVKLKAREGDSPLLLRRLRKRGQSPNGSVGRLRERLTHYTCTSYSQYLPKLSRYAEVQARIWQEQGRAASLRQLLLRFPLRFLQGYVLRLGFLDGLAGLQVCVLVAYLSWLKQAYLWQLQTGRDWHDWKRRVVRVPRALPVIEADQSNEGTGAASGTENDMQSPQIRQRSIREIRRRLTPTWLRTDAQRQRRNIFFRRMGIQRCYTPPVITRDPTLTVRSSLPFVVAHELLANPRLTFLQIGAFDGVGDDDLRQLILAHKLRGVLVEPQPSAFARLQQTYASEPQVTLLQAAIAEREGTRELYCKRGEASMAASFDREHLRKHGIPASEIVAQRVPCHTVESALRTAGMQQVDLLQIDAEGYDWPIIRSIDFTRLQPRILRFEYRHMSGRDADACLALLAAHGYRFIVEARDIIAVRATGCSDVIAAVPRRIA